MEGLSGATCAHTRPSSSGYMDDDAKDLRLCRLALAAFAAFPFSEPRPAGTMGDMELAGVSEVIMG